MKRHVICLSYVIGACLYLLLASGEGRASEIQGDIVSVRLYQNQAMITRSAKVSLKEGINKIIVTGLPPQMYDWSVRGKLPVNFTGKIQSVEVSKHALTQKRRNKILEIEEKLEALRDRDQVMLDDLKSIASQERFLESVMGFTGTVAAKEITTGAPQVSVWDGTLNYVKNRMRELHRDKRKIEGSREELGKEIQKWEFELSQAGGSRYYNAYQAMNRSLIGNRSRLEVQHFDRAAQEYGERDRLLKNPEGTIDYEKRVEIAVYAGAATRSSIELTYIIPNTRWGMKYDIRASESDRNVTMSMFADIYQKTGEDWDAVNLFLSTGQPVHSIAQPTIGKWILDIGRIALARRPQSRTIFGGAAGMRDREMPAAEERDADELSSTEKEREGNAPTSVIEKRGVNFEVAMPLKQTIPSSERYQKKMIRDFALIGRGNAGGQKESPVRFFYELFPSETRDGFLKVAVKNTTSLPWLEGEAQIFLENEFMGKATIPFTAQGKEQEIVLGIENRVSANKELVKKFEDNAGLFGGRRRILYQYRITLQNDFSEAKEAVLFDAIPVSRNKQVEVAMENLTLPFLKDDETVKGVPYSQGIRKWTFTLNPYEKREISYDLVVTFDKNVSVSGLR
ncbi:MAG: mucoidy inhibitor MuiA family protein [Spirochaetes bacterium]|nr:mucoidy inhibitor MuiA family protein [Spirochaetota bacterium]